MKKKSVKKIVNNVRSPPSINVDFGCIEKEWQRLKRRINAWETEQQKRRQEKLN